MFDATKYTKSRWLKGVDLPRGRMTTVTINNAFEHHFEQQHETKPVIEFEELEQALVLNKTQVVTLIDLFGANPSLWIGQRIHLTPVASNYQGKPTIQITMAELQPTINGQAAIVQDSDMSF